MQKLASLILFTFIISFSFSQIQRIPAKAKQKDTLKTGVAVPLVIQQDKGDRVSHPQRVTHPAGKAFLKELNITRDQKIKLKEIRDTNQEKLDKVNADTILTELQKKQKRREIRNEQFQLTQSVLTNEQKEKYKLLLSDKMKKNRQDE